MSAFDPNTFKAMTITGSNSTESTPVPVGEWLGLITKSDITTWSSRDNTKSGLKHVLTLEIEDPAVSAVTGRPKSVVTYESMLDLTPEGGLDMGKGMNTKLGRAREACNLNDPSRPFSFDMFIGHQAKASIKHESLEDGRLVARVNGLAKA